METTLPHLRIALGQWSLTCTKLENKSASVNTLDCCTVPGMDHIGALCDQCEISKDLLISLGQSRIFMLNSCTEGRVEMKQRGGGTVKQSFEAYRHWASLAEIEVVSGGPLRRHKGVQGGTGCQKWS